MADRWGLLIGIDRYPRLAERYQLAGCVNDIRAVSQLLVERFGFPAAHLTQRLNGDATRQGILTALKDLVERVGEGDAVLFHYSGHGSQKVDLDGDESDGLDETIVPSDSGRAPDPNLDIIDDEIHDWLGRLTAKTPNVTLVFDSCHSGTVSRGMGRARGVPPDLRRPAGMWPRAFRRGPVDRKGPGGWLPAGSSPHFLLSACRSSETSHELQLGAGGPSHGALTYCLLRVLSEASPDARWGDLFDRLAPQVTTFYPGQHPELEGARDRPLFGSA
jgi:hypothetical protein